VPPAIFRQQGFDSMSECDDGVDKNALPHQAQPPQLIRSGNDEGLAARRGHIIGDIIDGKSMERQGDRARNRPHVLDHARFNAGIVGLYEAVLNEPIPEKMLRLIAELGKQERKS
jgi:hypothetical protein